MKRVCSFLVVCSLLITNAFAFGSVAEEKNAGGLEPYSAAYVTMVENVRTSSYNSLQEQLRAQDAMHLYPVFKEVIDREIDTQYYSARSTNATVYAPNGGAVWYGDSSFDVVVTYLDEDATWELYRSEGSVSAIAGSGVLENAFEKVVDELFSDFLSFVGLLRDILMSYVWTTVLDGTGCCFVICVDEHGDGEITATINHWSSAYNMSVPSSSLYAYVGYEQF